MPDEKTPLDILQEKFDMLTLEKEEVDAANGNLKLQVEELKAQNADLDTHLSSVSAEREEILKANGAGKDQVDELKAQLESYGGQLREMKAKLDATPAPAAVGSSAKSAALDKAIKNMLQRLRVQGFQAEVNEYEKAKALLV